MIIKVNKSFGYNGEVLINLDKVTVIKPYRGGTRFYFGKDDVLYVAESYDKINKIIESIYD